MARYEQTYKKRVVARLLPPESAPVDVVSREVGVSVTTLERRGAEMLADASGDPAAAGAERRMAAARLQAVIAYRGHGRGDP